MPKGIVSYGTYVPYWRLERSAVGQALGTLAGPGTRAVASFDEDTTTMGVEAARVALAAAPDGPSATPTSLLFSTTEPAYADKTNATAIHAALALDRSALAVDMVGAVRSGVGALRAAADSTEPTLLVLSDTRTGLPGGSDESGGGDGAAAFLFGTDDPVAELAGMASATGEFLDRWRLPGEDHSQVWEERFGEAAYLPLAEEAFDDALKGAGLAPGDIDHLIVTGVHARAARAFARVASRAGVRPEAVADDLSSSIGNTGAAHPGVLLCDVLDRARPGSVICRVILADGASVSLWRTTEALDAFRSRPRPTVADQIAAGRSDLDYLRYLSWRGQLHREPPRRPDPTAPATPPAWRHDRWKFAFTASRCDDCGTRHLPPARVCVGCGATDHMSPERLADTPATVATFTVDRLSFSPSPPLVAAVVDFDGGGRFRCEVTDVDPAKVAIGDRVTMTFRRISTANGIHNYFWKARPARPGEEVDNQ